MVFNKPLQTDDTLGNVYPQRTVGKEVKLQIYRLTQMSTMLQDSHYHAKNPSESAAHFPQSQEQGNCNMPDVNNC